MAESPTKPYDKLPPQIELGGIRPFYDDDMWKTLSEEGKRIVDPKRLAREEAHELNSKYYGLSGVADNPDEVRRGVAFVKNALRESLANPVEPPSEPFDPAKLLDDARKGWPKELDEIAAEQARERAEIDKANAEGYLF